MDSMSVRQLDNCISISFQWEPGKIFTFPES